MTEPGEKKTEVVAVLIATCRRPEGLERLIRGLAAEAGSVPGIELMATVADNDPEGSAREIVERLEAELGMRLVYAVEERRGIPFARNKSMELAEGLASYYIFVDDDEVPRAGWLAELLAPMRAGEAEVVTGPVVPVFLGEPEDWIVEGGFLQYHRHETGKELDRAYTNNTLVAAETIARMGLRFEERMDATGGSDTHFFRRLHLAGGRIVWNDRAEIEELIPTTRSDAGWIYQRAFRIGNSTAFIETDLFPFTRALRTVLLVGLYRIAKGLLTWPLACFGSRAARVTAWRHVCYGAGLISGLFGFRYREYRKIHGR